MEFKTEIKKGFNGWAGKSEISIDGKDWQITTMKRHHGSISTLAQSGIKEKRDGYSTFTFIMYQDPSMRVNSVSGVRATQKSIDRIHSEGLEIFKTLYKDIVN